jgi:hypothetical protein
MSIVAQRRRSLYCGAVDFHPLCPVPGRDACSGIFPWSPARRERHNGGRFTTCAREHTPGDCTGQAPVDIASHPAVVWVRFG